MTVAVEKREVAFGEFRGEELVREVFRPPEFLSVSEWADRHRRLTERDSSEPGLWHTSRTPYLREIMDAFVDPEVVWITVKACTQVGKTVSALNMVGYAIDQDPGPVLFVEPTEDMARRVSKTRLMPMIDSSPRIRRHRTGVRADETRLQYDFDRMTLYLAWANSPTALAATPCRYVILDETDKYPAFTGKESSPKHLAEERTKTYWNKKIVQVSTPTTQEGYIHQEFQKSDGREYWVPCPKCGAYQVLVFPQLKWPEGERNPDRIVSDNLAWYECIKCSARLGDRHKEKMIRDGVWCPAGCHVRRVRGRPKVIGTPRTVRHRGYHITALMSPWVSFSEVAAEFLLSKDTPAGLMNFHNSWLAETWVEKTADLDLHGLCQVQLSYDPGTVPEPAQVLTAGGDVHLDRIDYVVRAWGVGEESWLVVEGSVDWIGGDWGPFVDEVLAPSFLKADGTALQVRALCIDSGYATSDVYAFSRKWAGRVFACKGGGPGMVLPWKMVLIERDPRTGKPIPGGQKLWHVNVSYFKDKVQGWRTRKPYRWWIHGDTSARYQVEVTAEHKVLQRNRRTGGSTEIWQKRDQNVENHFWDDEVYAAGAAEIIGVPRLREGFVAGGEREGYAEKRRGGEGEGDEAGEGGWRIGR